MVIYKITNKINNKIYIGQTVQPLVKRWNQHLTSKKNMPLYRSFRKHGQENFIIETICTALDPMYLDELERYFISYYNCLSPNGYNLADGGNSQHKKHPETMNKMSLAKRGKIVPQHVRDKISLTLTGRPGVRKGVKLSDETRKKISEAQIGRKASQDTKKRQSEAHKGANAYNAKKVVCLETNLVYGSTGEAARELGLVQSSISAVCLGKRKRTGGLTFKYV